MTIGKVVGTVVCTVKHPALAGVKLLLVRQYTRGKPGEVAVAVDATGTAGEGSMVYMISSTEAASALRRGRIPVDLAVMGIVDIYNSKKYQYMQ